MRNSLRTQSPLGVILLISTVMVLQTCANGYGGGGGYSYPVPRTPLEYPSYERKTTSSSFSIKKLLDSIERQRDNLRQDEKRVEEQERLLREQRLERTEVERKRTRERERDFLRFRDIQETVRETYTGDDGGGRERKFRDEKIRNFRYKDFDDGGRPPVDTGRNREIIREETRAKDRLRDRERELRERLNDDERFKPRDRTVVGGSSTRITGESYRRPEEDDTGRRTSSRDSYRPEEDDTGRRTSSRESYRPEEDDIGRRTSSRESSIRGGYSGIPDDDDLGRGRGRVGSTTTTITRGRGRGRGEDEAGARGFSSSSEEIIRGGGVFGGRQGDIVVEGEKVFKVVRYIEELDEFGNVIPGSRRVATSSEITG